MKNTFKIIKIASCLAVFLVVSGCQSTTGTMGGDSGGNVAALEALRQPAHDGFKIKVEASGSGKYQVGDPIRFKLNSEKPGKLWIIKVDSENRAELLFPRGDGDDNTLEAGHEYQFPPRDSAEVLHAAKPLGKTALAFVVTGEGVELSDLISIKAGKLRNVAFGSESNWGVTKLAIDVQN